MIDRTPILPDRFKRSLGRSKRRFAGKPRFREPG
jgi:hypothetical protein